MMLILFQEVVRQKVGAVRLNAVTSDCVSARWFFQKPLLGLEWPYPSKLIEEADVSFTFNPLLSSSIISY